MRTRNWKWWVKQAPRPTTKHTKRRATWPRDSELDHNPSPGTRTWQRERDPTSGPKRSTTSPPGRMKWMLPRYSVSGYMSDPRGLHGVVQCAHLARLFDLIPGRHREHTPWNTLQSFWKVNLYIIYLIFTWMLEGLSYFPFSFCWSDPTNCNFHKSYKNFLHSPLPFKRNVLLCWRQNPAPCEHLANMIWIHSLRVSTIPTGAGRMLCLTVFPSGDREFSYPPLKLTVHRGK